MTEPARGARMARALQPYAPAISGILMVCGALSVAAAAVGGVSAGLTGALWLAVMIAPGIGLGVLLGAAGLLVGLLVDHVVESSDDRARTLRALESRADRPGKPS